MWQGKRTPTRIAAPAPPAALPGMEPNFPAHAVKALNAQLQGAAILADAPDYHLARQGFVVNYQAFPQIIVNCAVPSDVAAALKFARRWNLSPVCRSGGHNAAGYSVNNEMIVDLSQMSYVVVDAERKLATVGAGTTFGHLNATLDMFSLHVPGGGCDDVAIAGYLQGGGFGITSQLYGMNSDCATHARVMPADGRQLVDTGPLWGFGINWKIGRRGEHAHETAAALEALQNGFTAKAAPKGLGHQSSLNFLDGEPCLFVRGVYAGARDAGKRLIAPLIKTKGANFDIDKMGSYSELNDYLNSHPNVPEIATHTRTEADSRYTERELSQGEWLRIVELFVSSPNVANFICLEGYGGAIRAVDPSATAFRHRRARFDVYSWIFWQNEDEETASLAFLEEFRRVLTPLSNGHAYQNYPNRQNREYRSMYWGENYPRLVAIKRKYDPNSLFRFGQTVLPPPGSSDPAVPADARADIDQPIQVRGRRRAPAR